MQMQRVRETAVINTHVVAQGLVNLSIFINRPNKEGHDVVEI
jgi:hypothetical protein